MMNGKAEFLRNSIILCRYEYICVGVRIQAKKKCMKLKNLLNIFILVVLSIACKRDNLIASEDSLVKNYIQQLTAGSYSERSLPDFGKEHITALLSYRNSTQAIRNFPTSGIASFYLQECTLGTYVLWTIESIRAKENNSKFMVMGFPSQLPLLRDRNQDNFSPVTGIEAQNAIAKAYFHWWKSTTDFKTLVEKDPLENTNYTWH